MNKKINTTVLLSLILFYTYAQEIKVNDTDEQSYKEIIQNNVLIKIDSTNNIKLAFSREYKEAMRKKNKQNLKKASKFYNPLTLIIRLFGI